MSGYVQVASQIVDNSQERDRQQLMQRFSCHMREVLALPIVIDDGSKVSFRFFLFLLLIPFQLLQRGTQLISEVLDDSSLNVLIDQVESVHFDLLPRQLFVVFDFFIVQVFSSLDMKSDSSARKLIQAARTLASEMSTKTG
jgi:hypothetical protein